MLYLAAQFFQLTKTGSALADVSEQVRESSVGGFQYKPLKDFAPRAVDALRIGKVFMHDVVKCGVQLLEGALQRLFSESLECAKPA